MRRKCNWSGLLCVPLVWQCLNCLLSCLLITDGAIDMMDEQFEELHKARLKVAELEEKLVKKKTLDFNVDHFFAVGSPLGIFIMLKEHDTIVKKDFQGAKSFLPSCICRRIHNLHHPSDPVVGIR